jgi:RNA-binding protein YlmH
VEASMRLDAVASAGFRMSRSKMMELIKSGGCDVVRCTASKAIQPLFALWVRGCVA